MEKKEAPKEADAGIRINRYLSMCGVCSRREADALICGGAVTILRKNSADTAVCSAGERVFPGDRVFVRGRESSLPKEKLYLLYDKARGTVCTSYEADRRSIYRAILDAGAAEKAGLTRERLLSLRYAGRLDGESEGLLLLTDDGLLIERLTRGRYAHEKEYVCRTDRPVTDAFIRKMAEGVPILDTVTRPCRVERTAADGFSITLTQGLNRQIRRMCEALGYRVTSLRRVRIMNLTDEGMTQGALRSLTRKEKQELFSSLGMEEGI